MDIDLPASALHTLHEELGSWPRVAEYLEKHGDDSISMALAWKVAAGKSRSPRVLGALYRAGFLDHPRIIREVVACPICLQVHTQHKRCPIYNRKKDARVTRAWKGTAHQAAELDATLDRMGFNSLREMIDWFLDLEREFYDGTIPTS